jgi:hypothetical protein
MVNDRKKITNARYYEANKERLKKLNMDKYNENKDIILQRKRERYHAKKQTAESSILLNE